MISLLTINNFQSHKQTRLKFHPKVNIITGTSDSGKTAIFRSLVWLINNKPLGKSFIRWNQNEAKVMMKLNKYKIERIKSNKINIYKLNTNYDYQAGNDVPENIKDAININKISIQRQLDPPFLLSDSPGEVAKAFNEIAELNEIDISTKNIKHNLNTIKKKHDFIKDTVDQLKKELNKYTYLKDAEKEIENIEKLHEQQNNKENKINELEQYLYDIKKLKQYTKQYKQKAKSLKRIEVINDKLNKLKELKNKIQILDKILCSIDDVKSDLKRNRDKAQYFNDLLKEKMPNVCPLCNQEVSK